MSRRRSDVMRLHGPKGEDFLAPVWRRESAYSVSDTTITLSGTPIDGTPVLFVVNGSVYMEGIDFTISGKVITPVVPVVEATWAAFYYSWSGE